MAYAQPSSWYVHAGDGATTGYYAIAQYSNKAWTAGQLVRPLTAPALGSERVYVCIVAGTSTAEPTWTFTKGAGQAAGGGVVFIECSGEAGVNGDIVNCPQWTINSTPPLGRIIYDPTSNALHACTQTGAGINGAKPTFSATLGGVTVDNAARWTNIGPPSNFGSFAAPHARVGNATAATWGAAGNDIYIADNSAETSTAQILINLGTSTSPSRFLSVDHTAAMPPNAAALKPGATFTTSAASTNTIIISSSAQAENYIYGCTFIVTGAVPGVAIIFGNVVSARVRFESCAFILGSGTIATSTISAGSGTVGMAEYINCSFGFSVAGQFIYWSAGFHTWRDTPNPCFTGTVPNTPLHAFATTPCTALFEGIDFSSASGTLFSTALSGTFFTLKNCKMNAGSVVGAFAAAQLALQIDLINCDGGGAIYRNERYNIYGNLLTSKGIYRTGGAVDGGVPISQNIAATSFCRPQRPFLGFPLSIWNDTVGSPVTVTVYGALNGVSTRPTNAQFWFDMEYMADPASPLSSSAGSGLANALSTPVTYAADAVSNWVGLVATNAPFAMSVTVTPQQKGYFTIYPKAGTSGSVYFDPKPVLS